MVGTCVPWVRVCQCVPWVRVCQCVPWVRVCQCVPWVRVCQCVPWVRVCQRVCHAILSGEGTLLLPDVARPERPTAAPDARCCSKGVDQGKVPTATMRSFPTRTQTDNHNARRW